MKRFYSVIVLALCVCCAVAQNVDSQKNCPTPQAWN